MTYSAEYQAPVAFVTGGARGIGAAISRRLSEQSHVIVGYQNSAEAAVEVVEAIEGSGGHARSLQIDVSDETSVLAAFKEIRTFEGRLDVLVNNAGVTRDGYLATFPSEAFSRVLEVDTKGVFHCCREAFKLMMQQRRGSIVSVVSASALFGTEGQVAYATAKGAVLSLTRTAAREGGRYGIRVNAVAPGLIGDTRMAAELPNEKRAAYSAYVPLGRLGGVEEVANAVAFLSSESASYTTGTVLTVDGGFLLGQPTP